MENTMQMEQFSEAFVCAIVAQAGCNHSKPVVDDHSIDLNLSKNMPEQSDFLVFDPMICIQLKSTAVSEITGDTLKFRLKMKNYNDLRKCHLQKPRILVVVCIPENSEDWIDYHKDSLILYRNAFWISLDGRPEISNTTSVTLDIPVAQRFDAKILSEMMEKVAKGEKI